MCTYTDTQPTTMTNHKFPYAAACVLYGNECLWHLIKWAIVFNGHVATIVALNYVLIWTMVHCALHSRFFVSLSIRCEWDVLQCLSILKLAASSYEFVFISIWCFTSRPYCANWRSFCFKSFIAKWNVIFSSQKLHFVNNFTLSNNSKEI